jgi:hypothetical protein
MPKQGQHENDSSDSRTSKGNNNPSKSQTITTGTYKKQETYAQRAREGKDPEPVAQAARNDWNPDTRDKPTTRGPQRQRFERSFGNERKLMPDQIPGHPRPEQWQKDLNPCNHRSGLQRRAEEMPRPLCVLG